LYHEVRYEALVSEPAKECERLPPPSRASHPRSATA
jgi:hypothetical protein